MTLVVALFVVDRYYSVLQWGAINKARGLERDLSLSLTDEMLQWRTSAGFGEQLHQSNMAASSL